MDTEKIEVFVKGSAHYFEEMTDTPASIGTPFLKENFAITGDYTATIGISGDQKGCIFLTVTSAMLAELLAQLGEDAREEGLLADLVGEIANIISGNARLHLGSGFMISVPMVMEGAISRLRIPETLTTFIVPILWKQYTAYLSISLDGLAGSSSS